MLLKVRGMIFGVSNAWKGEWACRMLDVLFLELMLLIQDCSICDNSSQILEILL